MDDLSHLAAEARVDLEQLRDRLQRLSDTDLIRFGRSAKYRCTPEANLGELPRPEFVLQLREARDEWRRRKKQQELKF